MVTGRRVVLLAVFVALLVGGWSFAHNHPTPVVIDYWLGQWIEVPLWLVMVCTFGAGVLLCGLFAAVELTRLKLVVRRYRSALEALESEVHQLRNLPLAAESAGTPARARLETVERSDRTQPVAGAGGGGARP